MKLLGCNVIISKWLWFTIHNHRITIVCGSVSGVTKTLSLIEQSNQTLEYLYYINTETFAGLIGLLTEGDSSRADDCWAIAKIELWKFLHNNGMRGLIHCPIPLSVMPYHACNAVEWCGSAKMTIDCVLPIQSHNQWKFEKNGGMITQNPQKTRHWLAFLFVTDQDIDDIPTTALSSKHTEQTSQHVNKLWSLHTFMVMWWLPCNSGN